METKDAALLIKLRELFALEAQEHLQAIATGLLELEKRPQEARYAEVVETLYREVHTLKGAARAVNLTAVETICQVTESVCAALKRREFGVWPELFDTLHRAMDVVGRLSATPEETGSRAPLELVKELEGLEAQGRARAAEKKTPAATDSQSAPSSSKEEEPPPANTQDELPLQGKLRKALAPQEAAIPPLVEAAPTVELATSEPSTTKKRRRTSTTPRKTTPKKPRAAKKKSTTIEQEASQTRGETLLLAEQDGRNATERILQSTHRLDEARSDAVEESTMEDPAQQEMLARLRGIFALEAEEYLQTITTTVLALEHEQDNEKEKILLETLFRCIHSLKGAARAVNFRDIEAICQAVESVCAALKRKEFSVWPEFFDVFHRVMDSVRQLSTPSDKQVQTPIADIVAEVIRLEAQGRERAATVEAPLAALTDFTPIAASEPLGFAASPDLSERAPEQTLGQNEPLDAEEEKVTLSPERVQELFDAPSSASVGAKAAGAGAPTRSEKIAIKGKGAGTKKAISSADVVRVETAKLDSLFLQAEEMLAVKLKTTVHASALRGLTALLEAWKREWALIHTDIRKTQRILEKEENRDSRDPLYEQAAKLIDFLDWTHAHFKTVDTALTKIAKVVVQDQQSLGGMVDILLDEAKKVLMLPFSSALEVLPKMARDLSRAQGKEVEFTLQGGDIEVDKRILEEIKDPLIHILRNCIDHGIEEPAERERQHKPRSGSIVVAISPGDGHSVEIVVQDDGSGIDAKQVREAAVRNGVIAREAVDQLSDQEAISLIFQSEVSTSKTISDISGRGLGMAIVREKVEKLGGHIAVDTRVHHGTTFHISLPLTLATFRGVLVQSAGQIFVVPTASVERVIRVPRNAIRSSGNTETISLAGQELPFLQLDRTLGLATKKRDEEHGHMQLALVVGQGGQQVAFGLDAVLNEQEVLFKGLGPQLVRVRNIAGATILGSGQVAPVLNVNDLLASAHGAALPLPVVTEEKPEGAFRKKSILVAEDSITSRMLLKEILESAGYEVSTAIDGEDAFSSLQKASFDLVVSDVEMPRLNGFDLASKIRGDERYAHLPVVLVTGLESQADRERGFNAGANAYVVKGSFDQSNLLETIRQFL